MTTLSSGLAVRLDDFDDNLGVTASLTAAAKTFAAIFEIFSAPGTTSNETTTDKANKLQVSVIDVGELIDNGID